MKFVYISVFLFAAYLTALVQGKNLQCDLNLLRHRDLINVI